MRPMGCVIFGAICVVAFIWGLRELGPILSLILMSIFGLGDSAVPVGFLIAGVFVLWCIARGIRSG